MVALLSDKPIPVAGMPEGIPPVTPYMLPRDYNTSSAAVIPHEMAAPLAPQSVYGRPGTPTTSGKSRPTHSLMTQGSYYEVGSSSSSGQPLLASGSRSGPSEASSGGPSAVAFGHDAENNVGMGEQYRPMTPTRAPSALSKVVQSYRPEQPPATSPSFHADSGLRFSTPTEIDAEDTLSQAATLPPAYTPYLYTQDQRQS